MHKHLYIVTHKLLFAGYQAVQGIHAAQKFAVDYPTVFRDWYESSNHIVFVSVEDELSLMALARTAMDRGLKVSVFSEPDMNFAVTAIAIEPGKKTSTLLKNATLALGEYDHVKSIH